MGTLNVDNGSTTPLSTAGDPNGTLLLSGATTMINRLNDTASVTLAGGTFNLGGRSEGAAGAGGGGALTLTNTSTLDFGAPGTTSNLVQFGGVNHASGTSVFSVTGYDTGATTDHLHFAGTRSNFTGLFDQGDVTFNGVAGWQATVFGTYYEISATAVPEPATWLAGALTLGLLG